MRDRFVREVTRLLDEDSRVAVILAEISAGLFRASGATARHPERVINVGIREQLMVGVAAGLSKEGFVPIVHTYAPFLVERPFEQLKLDLSHQGLRAVLVSIGGSRDSAASGRTHWAPEDVALISTLPEWTIYTPGHEDEAVGALRAAINSDGSVYVRLSDHANTRPAPDSTTGWTIIRRGRPGAPTVIAVGGMLDAALAATAGHDATVVYTSRPHPVDRSTVQEAVTGIDVVICEPLLQGTSTGAIAHALNDSPHRFHSIGFPNIEDRHYGTMAEHLNAAGLDATGVRKAIERIVRRAQQSGAG